MIASMPYVARNKTTGKYATYGYSAPAEIERARVYKRVCDVKNSLPYGVEPFDGLWEIEEVALVRVDRLAELELQSLELSALKASAGEGPVGLWEVSE